MINSILIPHFPPPLQYLSGLVFQRHLLHARPWVCLCVCVRVCACLFVCIRACVHTREETAESNCTGPSADCGKQACILQTQTAQTKNTQAPTNTHRQANTRTHTSWIGNETQLCSRQRLWISPLICHERYHRKGIFHKCPQQLASKVN